MAEIVSKAITTNLLLQLIMNKLILLVSTPVNKENQHIINQKSNLPSNRVTPNKISSFMINWSNKFVVITLLTISAIALSKQAWA